MSDTNSDLIAYSSGDSSSHNSRPRSPSDEPDIFPYNTMDIPSNSSREPRQQPSIRIPNQFADRNRVLLSSWPSIADANGSPRPSTPTLVYIVTSHFVSQTTTDGVRLSEVDIVGFQILAVFARVDDANAYAANECEEIDAGVRRRRRRAVQGGPVGADDGEGIRAEEIVREDGTTSWNVENTGQIEVGQWVVQ